MGERVILWSNSIFYLPFTKEKVHPDDMKQTWMLGFLGKPREKLNALSRFLWKANHYIKSPTRAEELAQWVKPLLPSVRNGVWLLRTQANTWWVQQPPASSEHGRQRGRRPWSKLVNGTSWSWWTLGSERDLTLLNQTDCNWGRHQGPLWASTGMWIYVLMYLHTCMHPYIWTHLHPHMHTE